MNINKERKLRQKKRIRAKIKGTATRLRLSIYRSSKYIYAQLIDDEKGKTVMGISEKNIKGEESRGTKTERAKKLGLLVAKNALGKKIKKVVFDKGSNRYHGRINAFAQGAREGGLEF